MPRVHYTMQSIKVYRHFCDPAVHQINQSTQTPIKDVVDPEFIRVERTGASHAKAGFTGKQR